MNVLTATDLAANAALASIAAMQNATGNRSEGPATRAMLRLDRVDHYRRFNLPEGEIQRRVTEDLRAQG